MLEPILTDAVDFMNVRIAVGWSNPVDQYNCCFSQQDTAMNRQKIRGDAFFGRLRAQALTSVPGSNCGTEDFAEAAYPMLASVLLISGKDCSNAFVDLDNPSRTAASM